MEKAVCLEKADGVFEQMKKVLIVCGKLYIGGAEKVAYSIGHYADPKKYECHYIVFGEEIGEYEEQLLQDGAKIFHISAPGEDYAAYWKNLTRLIDEYRYDVVHCHTMFNSGIVLLAAKIKGVPHRIAHSHSICSTQNRPLHVKLYERMMRFLIKMCATDYVACGKKAGEWLFGKKLFQESGTLLLNGIDTERFRYSEENRAQIRRQYHMGDHYLIGHVGHLAKVKNQMFLLDIMPEIIKKIPSAVLILIGEGEDRKLLEEQIVKRNLTEQVIMTGNVGNVFQYLSAMDAFVFPSLYEGMPLTMLEVQANGLPCVISDAVPEDVYLTDLLKTMPLTASKEHWANAIASCQRSHSSDYAAMLYQKGYDIESVVKNIYFLYERELEHV